MYTITKDFHFSSAHFLSHLGPDHKCARLHGHNYTVRLELADTTLFDGMVLDYGLLSEVKKFIDDYLDHRVIIAEGQLDTFEVFDEMILIKGNDTVQLPSDWCHVLEIESTTAENIAEVIFRIFVKHYPQLVAVHVSETPKVWASYSRKEKP